MKKTITPFLMLVFLLTFFNVNALPVGIVPVDKDAKEEVSSDEAKNTEADIMADWKNLSRKEKRAKKRALKKELKKLKKQKRATDDSTILIVILAILLPPAAVAVYEGITNRFWISLLLTLLFFLPGLIYALIVVLE
ncbi:MAG: YqaE/Pmp3 family membrane protein [Saprospiraceae bacterium]